MAQRYGRAGCLKPAAAAALSLALGVFIAAAALAKEEVGQRGDLRALRFEGCKLIPEAQVRASLRADAEMQTAASPSASLTELLNTVQRRIQIGYEEAGFLRARVLVRPDDSGKGLFVLVEEGMPYKAGRVRVEGAQSADGKAIERALTEAKPGESSPAEIKWDQHAMVIPTWKPPEDAQSAPWRIGRPAALSEQGRGRLLMAVREALVNQGFCWTELTIEPVPLDDGTAELLVSLKREGPRAVLDEIKIQGLRASTPQDVIRFLGLERGAAVDLAMLRRLREKLWETGRFVKHEIRAEVSREQPGRVKLTLDLREHPSAAALGTEQPIDPSTAALFRLAQSLRRIAAGEQPIVAVADIGRLHVRTVFQNGKGIIVRARRDGAAAAATTKAAPTTAGGKGPTTAAASGDAWSIFASEPMDLTWVSTADRLEYSSSIAGRRYSTPRGESRYQIEARIDALPAEEDEEQKDRNVTITVGAGWKSVGDNKSGGVALQCTLAPLFFFDLAHPANPTTAPATAPAGGAAGGAAGAPTTAPATAPARTVIASEGGILTVKRGDLVVRVEQATGKLVDLVYTLGEEDRLRVTSEPDALDKELAAIAAAAPAVNDYDGQYPISSAVHFFAEWYAKCPLFDPGQIEAPKLEAGAAVIAKLAALKAIAPIEDAFDRGAEGGEKDNAASFSIPNDAGFVSLAMQARGWLYVVDNLFRYGSWSWTIAHEGVMVVTGGSANASDELRRVMSSGETGPVGCLAIAVALRPINPDLSRGAAQIGLSRLRAEEFAKDFRVLFQDGMAGAHLLNNLAQGIADLSEGELNDLCALLPAGSDEALRFIWKLGRQSPPGSSMEKLLAANQREWWDAGLRRVVEGQLKRLAEGR